YEPPQFPDGCPPDQDLYSGPLGSAVNVSWVEPKVTDNSGQKVRLSSNYVNGAQFGPGPYHTVKITATDSAGNNGSCATNVYVKTVVCGSPKNVSFGSFSCSGDEFQTICPLDCDQGYAVRDGPGSIQCLANASWSIPGSCQDVDPPVFVECPDNVEVYGSRLGEDTQAAWALPRVTDNSGKDVQLTSNHNPGDTFPTGVTRVTYTATDVSGNEKLCQFSVTVTSLVCQPPDLEPQNRTNNIMLYDCPDGYVFGAKCGLSCSYGYPLLGADTIACDGDNSTFPPNIEWVWTSKRKPECIANNCTQLPAPANGALACNLGNFGWDCLMSCNEHWDVPAQFTGHFYCTNSKRFWEPSIVPNCTIRITPVRARLHSSLFYYSGDCNMSLDELKANFITRMKNSPTLRDACANTCEVENIQVKCGPTTTRRKRFAVSKHLRSARRNRQAEQNVVLFDFDIAVDTQSSNAASSEFYQEARDGHFNIGNLVADQYSFAEPTIQADCPPGTFYTEREVTLALSCTGCGAGHYLPEGSTKCEECPVGSYSELDNATSCTPCPPGWSTPTAGSPSSSSCKALCVAGTKSTDGYTSCQACPPGTYQSRAGATRCDACPVGTWTVSERTAGQDQCIPWHNLKDNASANFTLDFRAKNVDPLSVFVYTDTLGADAAPQNNRSVASVPVSADEWAMLSVTVDPHTSNISIYHQDLLVQSVTHVISSPTPSLTMTFAPLSGKVVISGLHASPHLVSPDSSQTLNRTCWDNAAGNILTWTPSPSTLYMPSKCDAVDECLSNPCGPHPCENQPDVNGNWTEWSDWTDCSASCSGGERTRQRECSNPAPQYEGRECDGVAVEREVCNVAVCPQHGGFGPWSGWTLCSASCGGGFKSRQRLCDSPSPAHGGNPCVGDFNETVECNTGECPVCSNLTHSNTTELECNETRSPYLITCNLTCITGFVSTMDFPLYTCGPKLAKEVTMTQSVTMNTGCDGNVTSSVPSQVQRNSAMLPCMKENSCAAKVTTSCEDSTNGNGTGKSLVVHYELTVGFDSNVTEAENETAAYYKYADFIRMADESVGMLVQNDTEDIYTVEVGGEQITPDLSAVMYRAFIACPEGTITTGGICTDCPAGYKEENGECVPCPQGQYQDQPGSTNCKLCPEGKFWDVLGAVSIDQCIYSLEEESTPGTSVPHTTDDARPTAEEQSSDINVGAIVGGVLGGVIVAALVTALVVCKIRSRRARSRKARTSMTSLHGVPCGKNNVELAKPTKQTSMFLLLADSSFVMDIQSLELPSSTSYVVPLMLVLSLLLLFRHQLAGWFLRKPQTVSDEDTLRLVVFGKTGAGKSSTCNTIIGKKAFRVGQGVASGTQHCQSELATVNGRAISVVDTPGVHATDRSTEDVANEIAKCILLSSPGPHAFLMVINLNQRFTDQEYAAYTMLKELFGPEVKKYVIVAFSWADQLEQTSIENYLRDVPGRLKEILSETGKRYLVFNNKGDKSTKAQQVRQLLSLLGASETRSISYFESSSTKEAETEFNQRVQQTMKREHISPWKAKERILKGVEANSEEVLIRRVKTALGIVEKLANATAMMAPLFGKQTVATRAAAVAACAKEAQNVCTVM
ncbi:hypothetical protein BaRGS_00029032, partial [Batillaria attramentaria]